MVALTSTVLFALTASSASLFTAARPDTVHVRQVLTDTVQEVSFTSDISVDRRIRLSLRSRSLDKPIVTMWMNADTIDRWLHVLYKASSAHELALTGESLGCEADNDNALPKDSKDSVVGHLLVLGSSVAVTPMSMRGVPIYKIDVMDLDQDRTATLGVTSLERIRMVHVLSSAVKAAQILSDAELRRDGPLAAHRSKLIRSSPVPAYPEGLRQVGIEGSLEAWFIVDTTGRADMRTFQVRRSTDPAFTRAVRRALPRSRFTPASIEGHMYRQCAIQSFNFTIR